MVDVFDNNLNCLVKTHFFSKHPLKIIGINRPHKRSSLHNYNMKMNSGYQIVRKKLANDGTGGFKTKMETKKLFKCVQGLKR